MKKIVITLLLATVGSGAQADLLLNGDFSSTDAAAGGNHYEYQQIDTGWGVKGTAWTWAGGQAVNSTAAAAAERPLAQIVSAGSSTLTNVKLEFDWTAPSAATHADALGLTVALVLWNEGVAPDAIDPAWNGLNNKTQSTSARQLEGTENDGSIYDIIGETTAGGNLTPVTQTFAGTAGSVESFSQTYSLPAALNTYDYIGILMRTGNDTTELIGGGIVDNVALTAVIPEPATLGVIAASGIGILFIRRRFMM